MKVDMSPEAVSMRLDSMGELWELSVALMDSIRIPSKNRPVTQDRESRDSESDGSQKFTRGEKKMDEADERDYLVSCFRHKEV